MGISIGSVEADTLQGRSNEAEITLVRELYAEQIGIACVFGLREAGIYVTLVFVVVTDLIYNEIVDLLAPFFKGGLLLSICCLRGKVKAVVPSMPSRFSRFDFPQFA